MSMPKFPDTNDIPTREEALNAIITSIAMEEAALARILSAESDKIESVLRSIDLEQKKDRELLLCINQSVERVVERVGDLQMLLKNKLRLVTERMPYPKPCPPHPPVPPKPKPKPKPRPGKCISKFVADARYTWSPCRALNLCHLACCEDGVRLDRINNESVIILPAGKRYDVDLTLHLTNRTRADATIELRQTSGNAVVFSKKYSADAHQVNIHDRLMLFAEGRSDSQLTLRLQSKKPLEIREAQIEIKSR